MTIEKATFRARLDLLPAMLSWVRERCSAISPTVCKQIELLLEEALVNIIKHAYQTQEGEIGLSCSLSESEITFTLKDEGLPFNPLATSPPVDTHSPLEQRQAGGLGLPLIRKYADALHYERRGSSNLLILKKRY